MIFSCANPACQTKFKSHEHDAKYCSVDCCAMHRRRVDRDKLKQLAFTGAYAWEIAEALGVQRRVVRKWLRRDGLLEMWREQRYA